MVLASMMSLGFETPLASKIKAKNNQIELHKTEKLLLSKGNNP